MKKAVISILVLSLFVFGLAKKPANTESLNKQTKENSSEDFSLKDLTGKKVALKDFKEKKVVLLVFFATWCHYCVQEIPELKKMQDEYKDKDLMILAIDIKESNSKVDSFRVKHDINYTILLDSDALVAKKYKVTGIPSNIVIDKDGSVKYNGYVIDEAKKVISDLLTQK